MFKTRSNKTVHPIGIGTWNIASRINPENLDSKYRGVEPVPGNEDQEIEAIRYSISKGQNHIDCAELYGGFYTDEVVGRAIAGMSRQDLFIADKLWHTSLAKGKVRPTVELMLKKLGTDYLDMLYIHWPHPEGPWQDAIPQIDELIDQGIVGHIGVSNFTVEQMQEATKLAKHPLVANQMNFNVLYKDEVSPSFRDFCKQHDIQIVAYQPIKRQEVFHNKTILEVAKVHGTSPAQVALAWLLQVGALPIPKAVTKEHIDDNLQALQLRLTDEEMKILEKL